MVHPLITPYSVQIGVAGAGVMGRGIALAFLMMDSQVTLFDVSDGMLDASYEYIQNHLVRKGKESNLANLKLTSRLEDLEGAGIIIEAIPEDIQLKTDLFRKLDACCQAPTILATNTSTLSVTAIAASTCSPQRVAGLHFFNPAPIMPLVEIIRGSQTDDQTIQTLQALVDKLGKTAVLVADTPGFIVNRVSRPFFGEALRLLGDRIATHDQIDLVVEWGGGFRMGPFRLMDLIGIDVNLAAMQSMYEQSFGEPRYRPHPIQTRLIQQNRLGRKSGRGFYEHGGEKPPDPLPPEQRRGQGLVALSQGSWAPGIHDALKSAGYKPANNIYHLTTKPLLGIVQAGRTEGMRKFLIELDQILPADIPILCQCSDVTLTEAATWVEVPDRLVGMDGIFFAGGRAVTLVASPTLSPKIRALVDEFITGTGRIPVWIEDSPGLILPRIMAMLANEAAFAVQEGVAQADQIDLAMKLGASYPTGPLSWANSIGYTHVLDLLDHLHAEFGEDRHRPANLLRRWARLQQVST